MKTIIRMLRSVAILTVILQSGYAQQNQQVPVEQRDALKKQLEFEKWEEMTKEVPAGRIEKVKLADSVAAPWQVRRSQDIGQANRGTATQYILSRGSEPKTAEEVIRVTVTVCENRNAAAEGLIDHLSGVQRPDLGLVKERAQMIGDLTVQVPGTPEGAIYFIRSNVLVCVENGGRKPAQDLREVARKINSSVESPRQ